MDIRRIGWRFYHDGFSLFDDPSKFLSAANRLELEPCLRHHRKEHGIARRASAILFLDKGKPCGEIAEFLYLDDDTIRSWYKVFRQEGGMLLRMTAGRVDSHA